MEKIWFLLKPGGFWINFGPLLYHFSDTPSEKSIELSYEQIKRVMLKIGFKIVVNLFVSKKTAEYRLFRRTNPSILLKFEFDTIIYFGY